MGGFGFRVEANALPVDECWEDTRIYKGDALLGSV